MIAVVAVNAAHILLDLLPHRPALGVPKNGARRMLVDMEQIKFATEFAVITLFGFF